MYTPWYTSDWVEQGNGNWANIVTPSDALKASLDNELALQSGRSGVALGMLGDLGKEMQTPDDFFENLRALSYSPDAPGYSNAPNVPNYDRSGYQDYRNVDTSGYGEFETVGARAGVLNTDRQKAEQDWMKSQLNTPFGQPSGPIPNFGPLWKIEPSTGRQVRVVPKRPDGPNQTTDSARTARGMMGADPQNLYGLSDINAEYDPRFETTMYDRAMSLLRPDQEQKTEANRTLLANMGLSQGGEAYDDSVLDLRNQQDEATQRVAWDSVMYGAQEFDNDFRRQLAERGQQFDENAFNEQRRLQEEAQDFNQQLQTAGFGEAQRAAAFGEQRDKYDLQFKEAAMANAIRDAQGREDLGFGAQEFMQGVQRAGFNNSAANQNFMQGLQAAGFNNTARNQEVADQRQREGWSLNKINALMSGQQVQTPDFQNFTNAGKAEPPNYLGATQQQTAWQGQVNSMWGDIWGGLAGGLGSAAGGGFFGAGFGK